MSALKKLKTCPLPQDFSPTSLPEILKLAKAINDNTALVYECVIL